MRNKTNHTKNSRGRPAWVDMFSRRHKIEARTSDDRDWHTDVPNIKLSRAFVVVLVLHVVAVGGILAFEMFKPGQSDANIADTQPAQLDADRPAEVAEDTPAERREENSLGYKRYIVQAGDSITTIADAHRISRGELLVANRIDELHPLVQGRILRVPNAALPGGFAEVNSPQDTPPVAPPATELVLPGAGGPEAIPPGTLPVPGPIAIETPADSGQDTPGTATPAPAAGGDGFKPLIADPEPAGATLRPEIVAPSGNPEPSPRPRVVRQLPETPTAPAAPAAGGAHKVAPGDTLYRISRKHGVSVDAIVRANPGVNPRALRVGQTLRLP